MQAIPSLAMQILQPVHVLSGGDDILRLTHPCMVIMGGPALMGLKRGGVWAL